MVQEAKMVKMTLSYDGSHFFGSQVQNSGVKTVSNTLYKIFTSLGIEAKFEMSGRTDRGVHATRQVLSIALPPFWKDLKKLKYAINLQALPHIYIEEIVKVPSDFHARYSATKRAYRYLVSCQKPNVFLTPYVLFHSGFDPKRVSLAIKLFEGEHDFGYFCKQNSDVKTTVRRIYKARFYAYGDLFVFNFEANGFLRSQIRMMVSFLLKVGEGRLDNHDLRKQLSLKAQYSRDLVLPNGLYLSRIWY